MPKPKANHYRRKEERPISLPFSFLAAGSSTANLFQIFATSGVIGDTGTNETRTASVAQNFVYYRVVELEVTLFPPPATTANAVALGFYPSGSTGLTAPTSLSLVMSQPLTIYFPPQIANAYAVTHPQRLRIPRSELRGNFSWYRTSSSGPDQDEVNQFNIWIYTQVATQANYCVLKGVIEYKNAVTEAVALPKTLPRPIACGEVGPTPTKETTSNSDPAGVSTPLPTLVKHTSCKGGHLCTCHHACFGIISPSVPRNVQSDE